MSNTMLSVIMPCYNNFHLMQRGLESLKAIDHQLAEIIIVDDCSTDNTYNELLNYINSGKMNIKIIKNEKNAGPGVSRNIGITESKGKYITFLDADDFFDKKFWSVIAPVLDNDYDCILFDAWTYFSEDKKSYYATVPNVQSNGLITVQQALAYGSGSPWGKIFSRKVIEQNDVMFLPQMRCEDIPFVKHAFSCCNHICYIRNPLYMYVQQDASIMHTSALADPSNSLRAFDYMKTHIDGKYNDELEAIFIKQVLYGSILQYANSSSKSQLLEYIKECEKEYPNYINNKYLAGYPKRIKQFVGFVYRKNLVLIKVYSNIVRRMRGA